MKHGKVEVDSDITLKNGTSINEFSIDGTLAGNSDDAVPTEKAVKTYVDALEISDLSITGEAQGDIIYFNGTIWTRLPAGTNGYFLKTQGASANPLWAEGVSGLGTWASRSFDTTYQASTDGFIIATYGALGNPDGTNGVSILGYTDANSNPTTLRTSGASPGDNTTSPYPHAGLCLPVISGDYYKIVTMTWGAISAPSSSAYWIPLS